MSKKPELIRSVKGTRDLLPAETGLWQRVEDEARRVFGVYNFREIRTPVLEETALFARSVGADTDIVSKEMYTFEDQPVREFLSEDERNDLRGDFDPSDPAELDKLRAALVLIIQRVEHAVHTGDIPDTEKNRKMLNAMRQLRDKDSDLVSGFPEGEKQTARILGLHGFLSNFIDPLSILTPAIHGHSLTLRPEATASVVRAYIEHSLYNQGGLHKLYYLGPMFRRERPQKGRYRQFWQIGAEVLGSDHPEIDAEVLEMLVVFLERVGLREFALLLNSVGCGKCRPEYVRKLREALAAVKDRMCVDCQRRAETNPLRVLDCKVEADQPIIEKLPRILDYLCPHCRAHFDRVTSGLRERGIRFEITPRLVRGLDYYTRTTFEITAGGLGSQNAILGGGRYDGLSEMIGGPPAPGFGFAIGEDRLIMTVEQAGGVKADNAVEAYIAWMGEAALAPASKLARELRRQGIRVEIEYEPARLKKALGNANKLQARFAVIIGEGELASGRYQVKDMGKGEQVEVAAAEVMAHLRAKLAQAS